LRINHTRGVAAAVSALVLIFAGAALFSDVVPFSLSLRRMPDPGFRDDSAFGKRRIGEIVYTNGRGDACHKVEFHNDTGLLGRNIKVRCGTTLPEDYAATGSSSGGGSDRLLSLRDAFVKR
jgi:hypothetical protein